MLLHTVPLWDCHPSRCVYNFLVPGPWDVGLHNNKILNQINVAMKYPIQSTPLNGSPENGSIQLFVQAFAGPNLVLTW